MAQCIVKYASSNRPTSLGQYWHTFLSHFCDIACVSGNGKGWLKPGENIACNCGTSRTFCSTSPKTVSLRVPRLHVTKSCDRGNEGLLTSRFIANCHTIRSCNRTKLFMNNVIRPQNSVMHLTTNGLALFHFTRARNARPSESNCLGNEKKTKRDKELTSIL